MTVELEKTSIITRLCRNTFYEKYDINSPNDVIHDLPLTIDRKVHIKIIEIVDNKDKDQIFKLAHISDGFIVIYSIAEPHTYKIAEKIIQSIKNIRKDSKFHHVLLANKCDLPKRIIEEEVGLKFTEAWVNGKYFETSAENGTNARRAFIYLAS